MLTPEKVILKGVSVGQARLSGDGHHVAYVRSHVDPEGNQPRSALWLVDANGGNHRQLTWRPKSVASPAWRPDSRAIAYAANFGSDEHALMVMPLEGGEAKPIVTHASAPMALTWSPDGSRIAYTLKVDPEEQTGRDDPPPIRVVNRLDYKQDMRGFLNDARHQTFVVDVESGETRQLTTAARDHEFPQWSADGERIAVLQTWNNGMMSALLVYPAAGGDALRIGWDDGHVGVFRFSPDGSQILLTGYPRLSPQPEFYRYVLADDALIQVTDDLDYLPESGLSGNNVPAQPVWMDDDTVIVNASTRGMTSLFGLDVTGGVDVQITIRPEARSGLSVDDAKRSIVQTVSSPATPGRIEITDVKTHRSTVLIDPMAEELNSHLPTVEQITIDRGGDAIDAWVYLPRDLDPSGSYPVVLNIHGGPHNHHGYRWDQPSQYLAAAGYIVVAPNPRGSGTYGREFAEAVWGDWGGEDWQDDLAVLDAVLARPYADDERLGFYGYSYGGFMGSWVITQTDRFKAAVIGAPVFNFQSFFGTSDIGHVWAESQWGGAWQDPAVQRFVAERSPANFVHQAVTPTLIMHGEADDRCPIGQGEELFVGLRKAGAACEFVRYPGQGHLMLGSGRPSYRVDYFNRVVAWMDRWVKADPGTKPLAG